MKRVSVFFFLNAIAEKVTMIVNPRQQVLIFFFFSWVHLGWIEFSFEFEHWQITNRRQHMPRVVLVL